MMGSQLVDGHWDARSAQPRRLHLVLRDDDGEVRSETLDDVQRLQSWGTATIVHCQTRDPVIIRADGRVLPLVGQ
jgi:hypothetical protein